MAPLAREPGTAISAGPGPAAVWSVARGVISAPAGTGLWLSTAGISDVLISTPRCAVSVGLPCCCDRISHGAAIMATIRHAAAPANANWRNPHDTFGIAS